MVKWLNCVQMSLVTYKAYTVLQLGTEFDLHNFECVGINQDKMVTGQWT